MHNHFIKKPHLPWIADGFNICALSGTNMNNQFLTKIHGLRGFSIILVLFFHFYESVFRGGYLGVDIFFVISGYIVTKSTIKYWPSEAKNIPGFLKVFYRNRIARLLPVGLLVSTISLLLGLIFIPLSDTSTLVNFYRSSMLGLANVLLFWNQQDYFSLAQEFNFFTQTWSLGVEEQFYVIYSILACFVPFFTKKIIPLLIVISVLSLTANMNLFDFSDEARFYLLPFRFWEMGLGVLLFLKQDSFKKIFLKAKPFLNIYSILALLAAFFLKYSPNSFPFPILFIILPAVCYIIANSDEPSSSKLDAILNSQILSFFGTISYSLYLIHWPILVFTKYAWGKSSLPMTIAMVVSIFLAYIITHFYEMPLNRSLRGKKKNLVLALVTLVAVIGISSYFKHKNPLYVASNVDIKSMHWKQDFDGCIENTEKLDERIKNCFIPKREKFKNAIFAAGDSHAGQIALMLREFGKKNDYETILMHSGDKPNSIHSFKYDEWKSKPAIFEEIEKNAVANDIVVLTFASFHLEKANASHLDKAYEVWGSYIENYLENHIKVILVLDSPFYPIYPIESCIFDSKFRTTSRCEITREEYLNQRSKQAQLFNRLKERLPQIEIWDMVDEFCTNVCSSIVNNEVTYFDYNHISKERALKLEKSFTQFYNKHFLSSPAVK